MIPLKLKLAGFISYLEPATIDFSGFDVACISGNNGAGKSSLLDAITWALFGNARKRDDSIIHTRAKKAEVCFDFRYEGNDYRILRSKIRDKTASLEFYISQGGNAGTSPEWKILSEKGTRETESRIQETLHLDYDTFVNASFFLQGKADIFAQQRPAERKRILANVLGLETWDIYRERTSDLRKAKEESVFRLDGLIAEINQELSEEPERVRHLEQVQSEYQRYAALLKSQSTVVENYRKLESQIKEQEKETASLSEQQQATRQSLDQRQDLLKARMEERAHLQIMVEQAERIEKAHQGALEAAHLLEAFEDKARQYHELQAQRTDPLMVIERERTMLESERDQLLVMRTTADSAGTEIDRLKQDQDKLSSDIERIKDQITKRDRLDEDIQVKSKEQAVLDTENHNFREKMKDLEQRIQKLEPDTGGECPLCGQPLSSEDRERLLSSLQKEGKSLGDQFRDNQQKIKSLGEAIMKMKSEHSLLGELDEQLRIATRNHDQQNQRIEQYVQQKNAWESTGAPRLAEIQSSLENHTFAGDAHAELHKVDAVLAQLSYDPDVHEATRLIVQGNANGEQEFRELEKARAALAPLDREINQIRDQVLRDQETIEKLSDTVTKAGSRYAELKSQLPDAERAYSEMLDLQEKERTLGLEVGSAQQKVDVLDKLRKRLTDSLGERESITSAISELKTLERAFGKDGIPALLIEQALPEIEMQANELLEQLSDGNMSVRLTTLRDYKDKARDDKRETLDIIISDSDGTRDYEMYSGGEAFRVNFAIRLALSKVLAQRAGAKLQTLVIDEGFGSQDSIGRQRLIEAINTIKYDFEKILVITHMDELKDAFPTRIEVEKTSRGSTISLV